MPFSRIVAFTKAVIAEVTFSPIEFNMLSNKFLSSFSILADIVVMFTTSDYNVLQLDCFVK